MKKTLLTLGVAATMAFGAASTVGNAAVLVQEVYKEQCTAINQNMEGKEKLKELLENSGVQVEILYQGNCPVIPEDGDTLPENSVPETSVPESSVPEDSAPDASEPEPSPETQAPEASEPECSVPETEIPETSEPETEAPETSEPETEAPETSEPETQEPETSVPEPEVPETQEPETEAPDTQLPDTMVPETPAPETPAPDTQAPTTSPEESVHPYVLRVLELVNEERAAAGLNPVTLDTAASRAALVRAKETVKSFSHTRPDGRNFTTALTEQGVNYRMAGENIAWGQRSPEQVMEGWMNSAGHRANILNESYTHIGIGYHQENGVNYWTQLFFR